MYTITLMVFHCQGTSTRTFFGLRVGLPPVPTCITTQR